MTEEEVKEAGYNYSVGKFPFIASGKSLAIGEEEGFVKVLINKDNGQILGAHMIGHEVTELVSNFSIAMSAEMTVDKFLHTVFPHPTLSEAIAEAVMSGCQKGIHY
jgi:dihydrolipoamide dehydrogenase